MSIRKILAPLSGHSDAADPEALERPALETAFVVAQRMNSHLEVFCIEAQPSDAQKSMTPWMPRLAVDEVISMIESESLERRKRARDMFEAVADRYKAPRLSKADPEAGFSVSFLEETGEVHGWLANRGRLADLIVTACPPLGEIGDVPSILQVALRETGRPVLISCATAREAFPKLVAVAWNGSAEASRAVALGMDFLKAAEEVVIISVNEDVAFDPDADSLGEYLDWHGVRTRTITTEGTAHTAGRLVLENVEEVGAEMLIMGAYTRDRVRRVIFGGVTVEVLNRMTVPVLMVD